MERDSRQKVVASQGSMDSQVGKLKEHQAVPHHLPIQRGRQAFLHHLVSMLDKVHLPEQLIHYTSVQKGGVPGVSSCLEHTGIVTQLT